MDNIVDFQNSTYVMMQGQKRTGEKEQKKKTKVSSKTKELYFDEEDDQQPAKLPQSQQSEMKSNKNYKLQQKQRDRVPKLPTGTITRNFFDIQSQEDYQQRNSPTKLLQAKQVTHPNSKQIEKRYRNKIKLEPLKNADPKRVQIPENNPKQQEDSRQYVQKRTEENKNEIKNPEKVKKIEKRTTNNYKLNFQLSSSDHQEEMETKIDSKQVSKNREKKQSSQQEEQIQSQQIESQSQGQPQQQLNQEQRTSPLPLRSTLKIASCKQFIIKRDKQWLNKIWPQFNLHIISNNSFCLSAKMTGNNASTTFTISESESDFTQNGSFYQGKAKSNFIGNIVNIYNKGYNPTDFKNNKGKIRDLLATVEYETNFFGSTRPRNFRVFMLKPGFNYYEDLEGPEKGEDQLPLNQLYDNPLNKQKILVMTNRKPEWNQKIKGFMLNFGGKVKKPSIKNFILEDEANPETARLLFGKIDENQFRLDIGEPLSPIVGFGIALSTFGSKIGCQ